MFVAGWRHALRSEWPFIIIIIMLHYKVGVLINNDYLFILLMYGIKLLLFLILVLLQKASPPDLPSLETKSMWSYFSGAGVYM